LAKTPPGRKGGSAALTGKAMGKMYTKGLAGATKNVFDLKSVFYNTAESFSYSYGSHEGPINIGQMLGYAGSGFASSTITEASRLGLGGTAIGMFGRTMLSGITGDFTANIMNYYVKKDFKMFKKIQLTNAMKQWGKSSVKGGMKGFFFAFGNSMGGLYGMF